MPGQADNGLDRAVAAAADQDPPPAIGLRVDQPAHHLCQLLARHLEFGNPSGRQAANVAPAVPIIRLDMGTAHAYIRIYEHTDITQARLQQLRRGKILMVPKELIPTVAARFKALGDPGRLSILVALQDGAKTVSELVEITERSQPNVSQHLGALARAGFVTARRDAQRVYYSVADPYLGRICDAVCDGMAERVRREGRALQSRRRK
jgi:ArsR family transcriptional regulator